MKKERKGKHFIQKPVYPGGTAAMRKFVSQHKKYPKEALENNIEGVVRIKYDIDYKGNVVDTKVQSSLGYGCDEEAERVVRMFKFEVPKTRKLRVLFHKTINIHFKKPKPKKVTVQTTYQYKVTPSKKNETKKEKPKSYVYVVKG